MQSQGGGAARAAAEQILGRPLADLPWINEPFDFSALAGQRAANDLDARSTITTTSRLAWYQRSRPFGALARLDSFPVVVEGVRKGSMISYRDVTIEHQREQSLELMTEINRLMILSNSEDEFLKSVCDAFVRVGGFTLARIDVAVDDDAHSVRSLCFAGPYGYVANAVITWSDEDPTGAGPIGRALKNNIAVQVDDLLQDPSIEPWYTLLKQFSLRSCVSIP